MGQKIPLWAKAPLVIFIFLSSYNCSINNTSDQSSPYQKNVTKVCCFWADSTIRPCRYTSNFYTQKDKKKHTECWIQYYICISNSYLLKLLCLQYYKRFSKNICTSLYLYVPRTRTVRWQLCAQLWGAASAKSSFLMWHSGDPQVSVKLCRFRRSNHKKQGFNEHAQGESGCTL